MQDIPDKGVGDSSYYLEAYYTGMELTRSGHGSQGGNEGGGGAVPHFRTLKR
jgi:hypothetical protein